MGAERTGIGKKPRNDLVRADHMGAARLDQFDHHAQHGVVPAGYQGAENPRHLGQRLQRRTDIAPLRPPPHRTGKDDPVDSLGLESAADRGKVSDCANGMVEAGPIGIRLTRKRNDERVFALEARCLGHVMGKRSGAGDDGEPAFGMRQAMNRHRHQPLAPRFGDDSARSLSAAMKSRISIAGAQSRYSLRIAAAFARIEPSPSNICL